jgi:zinc transporter, ZIP family
VVEAALFGTIAGSSLLIGAFFALALGPSRRVIGLVMAFGAGALISAVAYELVQDALENGQAQDVALGFAAGVIAFFVGDLMIDRRGGEARKRSSGNQVEGSALAIFLGTLLDGVPESVIIGSTIVTGGSVSAAFLAAVFISNLPEAMSATYGLKKAGWPQRRLVLMWVAVTALSALCAAAGYFAFDTFDSLQGGLLQAFAAGALLTMLADTMMPEAFEFSGKAVGLLTSFGFSMALFISTME